MSTQLVATVVTQTHRYDRARVELSTDVAVISNERGEVLEQIVGPISKTGRKTWSLGGGTAQITSECAPCSAGRPTKVKAF